MNPALKQSVLSSCFNKALSQIGCWATIVAYFCLVILFLDLSKLQIISLLKIESSKMI